MTNETFEIWHLCIDRRAKKEEEEKEAKEEVPIETHFQEASEHMRMNKSLDLTNDQKGKVYGLCKQATKGKIISSVRVCSILWDVQSDA